MTPMSIEKTELEDAYLINDFYAGDERGSFTKIFEKDFYLTEDIHFSLNEVFSSVSGKNVIRGLHFQTRNPQAKIVSVLHGIVWDVIVDLRSDSSTFKKWQGFELSAENHRSLYVPRGFAHGFASLEDETIMLYLCDGAYDKETDTGIIYNDPDIGIEWPIDADKAIHSERDMRFMGVKKYTHSPILLL